MDKPGEHFKEVDVKWQHCDFRGKLNLKSLSDILMEAAWEHAGLLGFGFEDLDSQSLAWVLSRLSIDMNAYPFWKEKLLIHTWTSGLNGLFAIRQFSIMNEEKKTIGHAATNWLIINPATRRPVNPEFINQHARVFIPNKDGSAGGVKKLMFDKGKIELPHYRVNYSDTDFYGHLTTARYSGIILDSLPFSWLQTHEVESIILNIFKEAKPGNELLISTDDSYSGFYIQNQTNSQMTAMAFINWRQA